MRGGRKERFGGLLTLSTDMDGLMDKDWKGTGDSVTKLDTPSIYDTGWTVSTCKNQEATTNIENLILYVSNTIN